MFDFILYLYLALLGVQKTPLELNLRPDLGAYQGDGLITLTDLRYLTVLDHLSLEEGLIKGKV